MILHCNFEELRAIRQGADVLLEGRGGARDGAVAAPPECRAEVEALRARLVGDLDVETLLEQRSLATAVAAIVECLQAEMHLQVRTLHPAAEDAVGAYFDFAHALSVLGRLERIGREMEMLIEVITGAPATPDVARTFVFPD